MKLSKLLTVFFAALAASAALPDPDGNDLTAKSDDSLTTSSEPVDLEARGKKFKDVTCNKDKDCGKSGWCGDNYCQCDAHKSNYHQCPSGSHCRYGRCSFLPGKRDLEEFEELEARGKKRCKEDKNCGKGSICRNGACHGDSCFGDAECPKGHRKCVNGHCTKTKRDLEEQEEASITARDQACNSDSQCGQGNICHYKKCAADVCAQGAVCGPGYKCYRNECIKIHINSPKDECQKDADCGGQPRICSYGKCRYDVCTIEGAQHLCPAGTTCYRAECHRDGMRKRDLEEQEEVSITARDQACNSDSQCGQGHICHYKVCRVDTCLQTAPGQGCAPGYKCYRNECIKIHIGTSKDECHKDSECGQGNICNYGKCRKDTCLQTGPGQGCAPGYTCYRAECHKNDMRKRDDGPEVLEARGKDPSCHSNGECGKNAICDNGICRLDSCTRNWQCPKNHKCHKRHCVRK